MNRSRSPGAPYNARVVGQVHAHARGAPVVEHGVLAAAAVDDVVAAAGGRVAARRGRSERGGAVAAAGRRRRPLRAARRRPGRRRAGRAAGRCPCSRGPSLPPVSTSLPAPPKRLPAPTEGVGAVAAAHLDGREEPGRQGDACRRRRRRRRPSTAAGPAAAAARRRRRAAHRVLVDRPAARSRGHDGAGVAQDKLVGVGLREVPAATTRFARPGRLCRSARSRLAATEAVAAKAAGTGSRISAKVSAPAGACA